MWGAMNYTQGKGHIHRNVQGMHVVIYNVHVRSVLTMYAYMYMYIRW